MPKTVLIVEDDEDTRLIFRTALLQHGYQVRTATHGAEGVHLARRHRPDLVLLDVRMPVMDGWDTALYLRSDPETRSIPICAISGHELDRDEREAAGRPLFDRFLRKPIAPREVLAEVEAWIGPPDQELPPQSVP